MSHKDGCTTDQARLYASKTQTAMIHTLLTGNCRTEAEFSEVAVGQITPVRSTLLQAADVKEAEILAAAEESILTLHALGVSARSGLTAQDDRYSVLCPARCEPYGTKFRQRHRGGDFHRSSSYVLGQWRDERRQSTRPDRPEDHGRYLQHRHHHTRADPSSCL